MGSRYSVIQYLPDPVAEERINIGVIVLGEGQVLTRFLADWKRVEAFSGKSVAFLRDFEKEVQEGADKSLAIPGLAQDWVVDELAIRRMAECWHNSIQLTDLLGSTLPPERLLESVAKRFLKQAAVERSTRQERDKHFAVHLIEDPVTAALTSLIGSGAPKKLIDRTHGISGQRFPNNRLDFAVREGEEVYFGGGGISFAIKHLSEAVDHVTRASYAVSDIVAGRKGFPVGIALVPPERRNYANNTLYAKALEEYRSSQTELQRVGAVILSETNAEDWALSTVEQRVPKDRGFEIES